MTFGLELKAYITLSHPIYSSSSSCRFAYSVSSDDPLTSSDASCFTRRHPASVSYSCHFFRTTRICSCDGCTCCSCRRAYAWSSRILFVTVTVRTPRCRQLTPIAGTTWLPSTPMRSYASPALYCQLYARHPLRTAPREVRPSRQQSRLALRAQLIIVTCLAYCRALHSILLGRNGFTTSFDG